MLSKAELKELKALHDAKGRTAEGAFLAEGIKLTGELLGAFDCRLLVGTSESLQALAPLLRQLPSGKRPQRIEEVGESFDWSRVSSLRQPQPLIAVFALPEPASSQAFLPPEGSLSLLLDRVQDPGNLGTILRTADWFGVKDIYLAPGTADPFAPKVVQATMGALARVRLHRLSDTESFLEQFEGTVIGTFLGGEDLYEASFPAPPERLLLIMGNEGQGIHPSLAPHIDRRVTIPPYPRSQEHTESLNVAIATALLLGELRRRG